MASGARSRVAMIGCGVFARNHMLAWKDLPDAELVGVCDRDPEAARAAAELTGAPAFTDAAAMLDVVRPDVADIAAPAPAHLPLVRLCAGRGIDAIVQKPLAMGLAESVAIAEAARAGGVTLMVHENFRFQSPVRALKELVAAGAVGEPRYCRVAFRREYRVFPREPVLRASGRLLLMDMGVHVFDTARYLMGEIDSVSCRTQALASDTTGEDMASALVGFGGGAMGLVECSAASRLPDDPGLTALVSLEGREGAAVIGSDYRIRVRSRGEVFEVDATPPLPAWGDERWRLVQDSVLGVCRNWLDAARGRAPLETTAADNLRTLAAVEAAYASAAAGGAPVSPAALLAEAQRAAGALRPVD